VSQFIGREKPMSKTIEIMFDDLVEEKQMEILQKIGTESPTEMNWDVFPVAIIELKEA
jgi:hypothetical protein